MAYIAKNAARILRALFEICLSRNWGPATAVVLSLCKSVDRQMWAFEHPLSQFDLKYDIIEKLERNAPENSTIQQLRDLSSQELGELVRFGKMGSTLTRCLNQFPVLDLDTVIAPITKSVLRIKLFITASMPFNISFALSRL